MNPELGVLIVQTLAIVFYAGRLSQTIADHARRLQVLEEERESRQRRVEDIVSGYRIHPRRGVD